MSEIFLKLIHPVPLQAFLDISEDDLSKISALAQNHNLLMLTYIQLQKYQKEMPLNRHIGRYLEEQKPLFLSNVVCSLRHETIEKEVISLLKEEGIPAVVIKGNQIAREVYDSANCRACCDVDMLIKESDSLGVDSVLSTAGYTRTETTPLGFWRRRLHHAQYIHPKTHDLVEMHWNFSIPSFFSLTSEEIWTGVVNADSTEMKLFPDMMLILLLMHHHLHGFRELRILIDFLWASHRYEETIDWAAFARRLKKIGLVKTALITLNQIQTTWKQNDFEMNGLQTLSQEIRRMRYKAPKRLSVFFKMDVEKKDGFQPNKDKVMARFALDSWARIMFSFLKSIFPFPESIKDLYQDRRTWTLPRNYFRFMTWRMKDWLGA
jgi:hypothetical protein